MKTTYSQKSTIGYDLFVSQSMTFSAFFQVLRPIILAQIANGPCL